MKYQQLAEQLALDFKLYSGSQILWKTYLTLKFTSELKRKVQDVTAKYQIDNCNLRTQMLKYTTKNIVHLELAGCSKPFPHGKPTMKLFSENFSVKQGQGRCQHFQKPSKIPYLRIFGGLPKIQNFIPKILQCRTTVSCKRLLSSLIGSLGETSPSSSTESWSTRLPHFDRKSLNFIAKEASRTQNWYCSTSRRLMSQIASTSTVICKLKEFNAITKTNWQRPPPKSWAGMNQPELKQMGGKMSFLSLIVILIPRGPSHPDGKRTHGHSNFIFYAIWPDRFVWGLKWWPRSRC